MAAKAPLQIDTPTLPKMGGSIQSIGKGWSAVGTRGEAHLSLELPISPGRGFAPALSLEYSSQGGNSPFGLGWSLPANAITLNTAEGAPRFDGTDPVMGPDGEVWMPERTDDGSLIAKNVSTYKGVPLEAAHSVVRHWPRVEGEHALLEHWTSAADRPGFWLVHSANGNLHIYGKTCESRRFDPLAPEHVGSWLICESLNVRGEHVVYVYKSEKQTLVAPQGHDYRAQRYLKRVCYGNATSHEHLYAWKVDGWKQQQWHFQLVFDYGEHAADRETKPSFAEEQAWALRSDPYSNYALGFELGTRRLCRQVLMFHDFPDDLGPLPELVQRLLLEHQPTSLGYSLLSATHAQAYDSLGQMERRPPQEYHYNAFALDTRREGWVRFADMAGLNDGGLYQLVDLYGEGLPGVLSRQDQAWYYREPMRDIPGGDTVRYSEWALLEHIPVADTHQPFHQSLTDMTGDAKLDWVVAGPGLRGYFTLGPDRSWSNFIPFDAFPSEFAHPMARMADLVGNGLNDMALIGTRSVRLYANRREGGFEAGVDVPHPYDPAETDELPLPGNSPGELTAFADVLGCGTAQLIQIRHDRVKYWPSLGHGRFGKGFVLCTLPFDAAQFDSAHVHLADLDGSGAADLIYLTPDAIRVFMNHAGNGYQSASIDLPWPAGVRYDHLCQFSVADLQGNGCSSLILTQPHMPPRHWRYDLVQAKPYLLSTSCNNMGACSRVVYRSSAQEWLDEKHDQHTNGVTHPVSHLPLAVPLVKQLIQLDEITENRLTQTFAYRAGYYDGRDREFRGFALLLQTDTEATATERTQAGFSPPALSKTWFHTGQMIDPPRLGYSTHDPLAVALKPTVLHNYHFNDKAAQSIITPPPDTARQIARSLCGRVLRSETYNADDAPATAVPYGVTEHRYLVRVLRPSGKHQPYAVIEPTLLETLSCQYEPEIADDPICQHQVNLARDEYGSITHAVTLYYARRKTAANTPPFSDEHLQRWWRDAHDEAQQKWYLTQDKAQFIHHLGAALPNPETWRLGLPYLQRSNALVLEKPALKAADIHYENLLAWTQDGGEWDRQATLVGMSRQFYSDAASTVPLPAGTASFQALSAYFESAELDAQALEAFEPLRDANGNLPLDLKATLESAEVGYHIMDPILPPAANPATLDSDDARDYLWSVHQGFAVYAGLAGFYNLRSYRETRSHGVTHLTYDRYEYLITGVELADGCTTRVRDIDYRIGLPNTVEDANRNIQEARYSAFGEPFITSFHGTERGVPTGFALLENYLPPSDRDPGIAIENKAQALGKFATAGFWDLFCWMGQISATSTPTWRAWALAQGFILPSGHFYDRARRYLECLDQLDSNEQILKAQLDSSHRKPVYAVSLVADQFPDQPLQPVQIRASITCLDGLGRVLQIKKEIPPGLAWQVGENGELLLNPDGTPRKAEALRRWCVSQPVEYNNKGLTVREYRPYFADKWDYINDRSMRTHALHDRQFYDTIGRPTRTLLAKQMLQGNPPQLRPLSREMWYWLWTTVAFDENDLFDEPVPQKRRTSQPKK